MIVFGDNKIVIDLGDWHDCKLRSKTGKRRGSSELIMEYHIDGDLFNKKSQTLTDYAKQLAEPKNMGEHILHLHWKIDELKARLPTDKEIEDAVTLIKVVEDIAEVHDYQINPQTKEYLENIIKKLEGLQR